MAASTALQQILDRDLHTAYWPGDPVIKHIDFVLKVDFDQQRIAGVHRYHFDRPGRVSLDTKGLAIDSVTSFNGDVVEWNLGEDDSVKGSALSFEVPDDCGVVILYETGADAKAIQWLAPSLTRSGKFPMLFTQCEEIHARTLYPCQDTPGVQFTWRAHLRVPKGVRGLMAGRHCETVESEDFSTETWELEQPVPSYLFAINVGEFVYHEYEPGLGVWAEPDMIEAAALEFAQMPQMMKIAEELTGLNYFWPGYSVIVLPPAFPYGGMENPCMSSLSPSLVTGDGSGAIVVAHELAHSWTGNTVMPNSWRGFSLNEGWTVYLEFRIVEALFGRDRAMLRLALLEREYSRDVERFAKTRPLFASLSPDLAGADPDDAFSRVPYFQGAMLLFKLEELIGRQFFDRMMHRYIEAHKFTSISMRQFLAFLGEEVGYEVLGRMRIWEWAYEAGMPDNAPAITSPLIDQVKECVAGKYAPAAGTHWEPAQYELYFELLPRDATPGLVWVFNERFGLSTHPNTDVRCAFLVFAVEAGLYSQVESEVGEFLASNGRMKHLNPLYLALAGYSRPTAFGLFLGLRKRYHPIAQTQVARRLGVA